MVANFRQSNVCGWRPTSSFDVDVIRTFSRGNDLSHNTAPLARPFVNEHEPHTCEASRCAQRVTRYNTSESPDSVRKGDPSSQCTLATARRSSRCVVTRCTSAKWLRRCRPVTPSNSRRLTSRRAPTIFSRSKFGSEFGERFVGDFRFANRRVPASSGIRNLAPAAAIFAGIHFPSIVLSNASARVPAFVGLKKAPFAPSAENRRQGAGAGFPGLTARGSTRNEHRK